MSGVVVEVPALSRPAIRVYVRQIHEMVRLEAPPFPIVRFAEKGLRELIPGYEFEVAGREEMGDNHGLTYPDDLLIKIREDVYDGACRGMGRDRLTIAHEVGHLLLHGRIGFARRVARDDIPAYRSSEWQANCFAGELLVPSWWVPGRTAGEVAAVCKVSEEAAAYQIAKSKKSATSSN